MSLLLDTFNIAGQAVATVLADPPDPGKGVAPPGSNGIVTMLGWVAWTVFAIAVLGVLICAGRMMINNRRGEGGENAAQLGWVLAGCIIAASASAIVGMVI